jgi:hypothetical protein
MRRQHHGDVSPALNRLADRESAAVALRDHADDVEPKAKTFMAPRQAVVGLLEGLGNTRSIVCWDTRTGIAYA